MEIPIKSFYACRHGGGVRGVEERGGELLVSRLNVVFHFDNASVSSTDNSLFILPCVATRCNTVGYDMILYCGKLYVMSSDVMQYNVI